MAPRKKTPKSETEESKTQKTTGKKRGRPKGSKNKKVSSKKKDDSEEISPQTENISEENAETTDEQYSTPQNSLLVDKPTKWILVKQMQFGIINEGFTIGTVFTVDWANRQMRCEANGVIYNNIKDLEIAIKIGTVEPYADDGSSEQYMQQQFVESEARASKNKMAVDGRKNRDQEVRGMVSRSDQDVVQNIDISQTKKAKDTQAAPIHVTPSSEVTINKPKQANQMPVHYSDGAQDGQIVRASNKPTVRGEVDSTRTGAKPLSPVLSNKHSWDATKGEGEIRSQINQKLGDFSIKVDENGQQYVRGLPIIRDDSEASGPSMNAGSVVSMTKEQLAQRAQKIAAIKAEKQASVQQNRANNNIVDNNVIDNPVSNNMPQEVSAGMGYDDSGVTPAENVVEIPKKEEKKKNSTAGKLLRRR